MNRVLVPLLILGMVACAPKVEVDENELGSIGSSVAEFDPANKIIPFPNNLLFGETGLLNIPAGCEETEAATSLRSVLLNGIDGFAMMNAPMYATFSEPVDVSTVANHAKLYNMTDGSTVDLYPTADVVMRWDPDCTAQSAVDRLLIIPATPLKADTQYAFIMTYGLKATSGTAYKPSATWGFVRQTDNPVQIETTTAEDGTVVKSVVKNHTPFSPHDPAGMASIEGLDLLWNAHREVVSFAEDQMGTSRDDIILAWGFKTQSADVALDGNVAGSPANTAISQSGALNIVSEINDRAAIEEHLLDELQNYWGGWARDQDNYGTADRWMGKDAAEAMPWACGESDDDPYTWTTPCDSIHSILHGTFRSPKFQNPELFDLWMPVLNPAVQEYQDLKMVAFVPVGETPANGWPTVLWGHGIGDSKEQAYITAGVFNRAGIAVVATDWVKSGVRAEQISNNAAEGCEPGLTRPGADTDQCFNGPIDGNPGTSRDNMRQSVIDGHAFVHALRTSCSAASGGCGNLQIDTDNLGYFGHSLGGFIGGPVLGTTTTPFKAVVLNVTGIGWRDVAEKMTNKKWPCFFVNALIGLGVIEGETWEGNDDVGAFCIQEDWKNDPGYTQLATPFFWLMDATEPGVFTTAMGERHDTILVQEVIDDATVDNFVTGRMAGLLGMTASAANSAGNNDLSQGLDQARTYLQYGSEQGVKEYTHASAKVPEPFAKCLWGTGALDCTESEVASINATKLAVRQMQADYVQFLVNHLTSDE